MDLASMLDKCRRGQWSVDDLDWSGSPRAMSASDEEAVVQYFTDMAGIEKLAAELFAVQRDQTDDPVLREIFATFVVDEERHSEVARRLARYYDVRRLRRYEESRSLARFAPHFVDAIRWVGADIANAYITSGEVILDVALLRSINDHVHDSMSQRAMDLVNRDESRHIAVDFHMVERYSSDAWIAEEAARPARPLAHRVRAVWAFAHVLWYARPFFRDVFFEPMRHVDPGGRRMREAVKRLQLLGKKPNVARRPFVRFMTAVRETYERPVVGRVLAPVLERLAGADGSLLRTLFDEEELRRAMRMSIDELVDDTLAAKRA